MGLQHPEEYSLYARYEKGERNLISDVAGVTVGHKTLRSEDGKINTGVSVLLPHPGNIFKEKLFAAASVINGFGKSVGLVQMAELGTLESPIFLTNTLSVGTVLTAGVKYSLRENPEIGLSTGTVNVLVTECNDAKLNDIRGLHVTEEDAFEAIASASADFEEGPVGAGTGMKMMGLKGGIGSASRLVPIGDQRYTVGTLVMTNYGPKQCLNIGGDRVGLRVEAAEQREKDMGSCILLIATDAPLLDRQLKRVANRAAHAMARTGTFSANGSGDIAIAFSTANKIEHFAPTKTKQITMLYDDDLDPIFEASVEALEEALISSLDHGKSVEGFQGKIYSLKDYPF